MRYILSIMDQWLRDQYKNKGLFGNTLETRRSSVVNHRKETRSNILGKFRNIPENMSPITPMVPKVKSNLIKSKVELEKTTNRRLEMLKKWKEERDRRKQEEKKKSKAPFKVFHVEHKDDLGDVFRTIKGKPVIPKKETTTKPIVANKKQTDSKTSNSTTKKNTDNTVEAKTRPEAKAVSVSSRVLRSRQKPVEETKNVPVKKQKIVAKNSKDQLENKKISKLSKAFEEIPKKTTKKVTSGKNGNKSQNVKKEETDSKSATPQQETKTEVLGANKVSEKAKTRKRLTKLTTPISEDKETPQEEASTEVLSPNKISGKVKTRRRSAKLTTPISEDKETPEEEAETEVLSPNKISGKVKTRRRSTKLTTPISEDKENEVDGQISWSPQDLKRTSTPKKVNTRRRSARNLTAEGPEEKMESDYRPSSPRANYVTPLKVESRRRSARGAPAKVDDEADREGGSGDDDRKDGAQEPEICYVSPFVTVSRGKGAARKEYEKRKSGNGFDNSSPRSPKAAANYFTLVLEREIDRIRDMCKTWQDYKEQNNLTEDAGGLIDMTIGQSNLLITKKFEQFRGLIERCRSQEAVDDLRIQCEDLHGFWDMMYKQVTDLDKRFENLEDMRRNDWLEAAPRAKTPKKGRGGGAKRKKAAARGPKASSSLRQQIAAARKNQMKNNQDGNIEILVANKPCTPKRTSRNGKELSTPARGILKAASVKSEKIKSVAFHIPRENGDINERLSLSVGGLKRTPLQRKRSSRMSLNREKLFFK